MVDIDKYFEDHPWKNEDIDVPFFSLDEYKNIFGRTGKEENFLAEYLTIYIKHHPYAQKFSNWNTGLPSRIFDKLPSSFWLNKITFTKEELPALKTAVDADLTELGINPDNFSKDFDNPDLEVWGSIIRKIQSGKYINLEKHLLAHISNTHHILYPRTNTPHPLLLALFPILKDNSKAEQLILTSLIVSYSQAISDFFDKNIPQTENNKQYLANAIRTPMMMVSDNITPEKLRNHTRQDLTELNNVLNQIAEKLSHAIDETAKNSKDWDEVVSGKEPNSNHIKPNDLHKVCSHLKLEIEMLKGQNQKILSDDDVTIPKNYIKNQINYIENMLEAASKNKAITHHSSKLINLINNILELFHIKKPDRLQTPLEKDINEANVTLVQESSHFHP